MEGNTTHNIPHPEKYRTGMRGFSEHLKVNSRLKTATSPMVMGKGVQ